MWRACSRCGKIHDTAFKCYVNRQNNDLIERKLRATYQWTQKSLEIRERANWLCEVCRDQGVITYDNLEVHHITSIRDDKTKLLDNLNLICLCEEHHTQAESGKLDSDYLRSLARKREENPPCL